MFDRERPVQSHLDQPNFLAARIQGFHSFLGSLRPGAHHDENPLRIRRPDIVKQPIRPPDHFGKLVHLGLHLVGTAVVKRVRGFTDLEEHVGILRRAAQDRVVGRQRPLAVFENALHVDERPQVVFGQHFDFVHFVRSAEAVEEMQEGNSRLERGRVRNQSQVHGFLHGIRAQHRPAGGATEHDVAVIAKDGERVRGQGTGGHVKSRRRQLAGNFVHVRDHQEKALRCRERGRQRPGLQSSVHRAGRAAFALHLRHMGDGAPDIGHILRGPLIRPLAHRGRRSDGIDGDDLVQAIGNVRHRLIGVHGLEFALHSDPLPSSCCRECLWRNDPGAASSPCRWLTE